MPDAGTWTACPASASIRFEQKLIDALVEASLWHEHTLLASQVTHVAQRYPHNEVTV